MAVKKVKKDKVGIIVGGGPAPGINGVISSAVIEAVNEGWEVVGIMGGFKSLFDGNLSAAVPLAIRDVSQIHTEGGSILRTSSDYPSVSDDNLGMLVDTLGRMGIKYLITIGGSGTLTMMNKIEQATRGIISAVHVPKTINNDIPLPGGFCSVGYQTALQRGEKIIRNIIQDARTTGRWYFITTMGRHAGHLALGIGKSSGATLTLIPEEFGSRVTMKKLGDILAGSIIKRLSMKKDYGVAVLAEGLAEKLNLKELAGYEHIELDSSGRIRLSEIQLGRVLKGFVKKDLDKLGLKTTIVDKNIGYELRASEPTTYDVEYTRNLGYGAVRFLRRGGTGAMIVFYDDRLKALPFSEIIDPVTGTARLRTVDITSEVYEVGRRYMIRLEDQDFKGEGLRRLARTTGLTPHAFTKRFGYLKP
jgi:6-phosphofructokinase 1